MVGLKPENFTNAAQIFMYNCNDSIISNLNISSVVSAIIIYEGINITIFNNNISNTAYNGIEIKQSAFNKIINNSIFNNNRLASGTGIYLGSVMNTTISGNHIYDNSIGVHLYYSTNNTLFENNISDNIENNIEIDNSDINNIIKNNLTYARNLYAIYLLNSDNNSISQNNISNNNQYGIYFSSSASEYNLIYLNTFIGNNHPQMRYFASGPGNSLDNGSLGNYYGDYRTYYPTAGHDATIWNESYQIDSLFDNCPLVSPWGLNYTAQQPVLNPITPATSKTGTINLTWSCEGIVTTFYIYRNTSFINSIAGMTPIASVGTNNYTDFLTDNNVYYYVIQCENSLGKGDISNCENSTVYIMPQVEIIAPLNGTQFTEYDIIEIIVNVTDPIPLDVVELYRNTSYMGDMQFNGSLYVFNWNSTMGFAGINIFSIRAQNNYGKINDTEFVIINISLYIPPTDQPDLYNVSITNSTGQDQDNYSRGEQITYETTIRGDLGSGTYVVIAQTDDPILDGYLSYNDTVSVVAGQDTIVTFYFEIPSGVAVPTGDYTVYIMVWTDWAYNGGICVDYIVDIFTVV
jgi:parallel beta-helix repeat protein